MSHSMVYCSSMDSVLVFGGETRNGKTNQLSMLHCRDQWKWEAITPSNLYKSQIITPRSAHCAQLWNNEEMVVFGGDIHDDKQTNETWKFSLKQQAWKKLAPRGDVPSPRSCASSVIWKNHFYIFGGFPYSNDCFVLDIINERWRRIFIDIGPLPSPRSGMSMTLVRETSKDGTRIDPKIYIFGGRSYDKGDIFDTNDFYKIHLPDSEGEIIAVHDAVHPKDEPMLNHTPLNKKAPPKSSSALKKRKKSMPSSARKLKRSIVSRKALSDSDSDIDDISSIDDEKHDDGKNVRDKQRAPQSSREPNLTSPQQPPNALQIMKEAELETLKSQYEIQLSETSIQFQSVIDDQSSIINELNHKYDTAQNTISALQEEVRKEQEKRLLLAETTKRQIDEEQKVSKMSLRELKQDVVSSEEKRQELREKILEKDAQLDNLRSKLQDTERELQVAHKQTESEKYAHQTRVHVYETQMEEQNGKIQHQMDEMKEQYENRVKSLEEEIETLHLNMEQKAKVRTELYANIMQLENRQNIHDKQLRDAQEKYQGELTRLKTQLSKKEELEEEFSLRFQDIQELLDNRDEELENIRMQLEDEKNAATELQNLVESLTQQLSKSKDEYESDLKIQEEKYKQQIEQLKHETAEHLSLSKTLTQQISELRERGGSKESECEVLMNEIRELKNQLEDINRVYSSMEEKLKETKGKLQERTLNCTHLQETISSLHKNHSSEISQLVKEHKEENREFMKSQDEMMRKVQDSHSNELRLVNAEHEKEVNLLAYQRQALDDKLHTFEQEKKSLEQKIQQHQQSIDSLQETLKEERRLHEAQMQERLIELSKLKRLITEMSESDEASELQDEIHDLKDELTLTKRKHGQSVHENQILEDKVELLQNEIQDLNRVLHSKEEANLGLTQRLHQHQIDLEQMELSVSQNRLSGEDLHREQEQQFTTMLSDLRNQHSIEIGNYRQRIERLEEDLKAQKQNHEDEIHLLQGESDRLKRECTELRQQNQDSSSATFSQVSKLKAELSDARQQIQTLNKRVQSMDEEAQWTRNEKHQFTQEKQQLTQMQKLLKEENAQLQETNNKISEELRATIDLLNHSKQNVQQKYEGKIQSLKEELLESRDTSDALEQVVQQLTKKLKISQSPSSSSLQGSEDRGLSLESLGFTSGRVATTTPRANLSTTSLTATGLNDAIKDYERRLSSSKVSNVHQQGSPKNARRSIGSPTRDIADIERQTEQEKHAKNRLDQRIADLKSSLASYKERLSQSKNVGVTSGNINRTSHGANSTHPSPQRLPRIYGDLSASVGTLQGKLQQLRSKFVSPLRTNREALSLLLWTRLFNHFDTLYESNKYVQERMDSVRNDEDFGIVLSHLEDSIQLFESASRHHHRYGRSTLNQLEGNAEFESYLQRENVSMESFKEMLVAPEAFLRDVQRRIEKSSPEASGRFSVQVQRVLEVVRSCLGRIEVLQEQ
uniref:ELK domain-containing protein n=1 Tax=Percolomonas cosmopolitus TaxID=63605 RepID=A0A7S1PGU2_9EUKA